MEYYTVMQLCSFTINYGRWSGHCGLDNSVLFLLIVLLLISPHPLGSNLGLQLLGPSKVAGTVQKLFQTWSHTGRGVGKWSRTLCRESPCFLQLNDPWRIQEFLLWKPDLGNIFQNYEKLEWELTSSLLFSWPPTSLVGFQTNTHG